MAILTSSAAVDGQALGRTLLSRGSTCSSRRVAFGSRKRSRTAKLQEPSGMGDPLWIEQIHVLEQLATSFTNRLQNAGNVLRVVNNEGEIALARWHRCKGFKRRAIAIGAAGGVSRLPGQIKQQCSSGQVVLPPTGTVRQTLRSPCLRAQGWRPAWMQPFVVFEAPVLQAQTQLSHARTSTPRPW